MPLPLITNTIRAAVQGTTSAGHKWANILHFRKTGALSYAGAIVVLDPLLLAHYNVNNGAGVCWKQAASTTEKLVQISYTPLDGATATVVITHADAGTQAPEPLPANVSLVITLRTTTRGRSYRGRVYQNGFNEGSNIAPGIPSAGVVTGVNAQWNNFLTALGGSGVSLVVASYFLATATDVAACTVDSRWDTQRRRLNV